MSRGDPVCFDAGRPLSKAMMSAKVPKDSWNLDIFIHDLGTGDFSAIFRAKKFVRRIQLRKQHVVILPWKKDLGTWTNQHFTVHVGVSENSGTPKSSILIGFSIIFTIHFGVPLFLETPISEPGRC